MRKLKPAEKIYKAFYNEKKDNLYFNQLKELTGLGDSSLANVLRTLKQSKEIEAIKSKANTFYQLKNKAITKINYTLFDYEKLESLENNIKIPVRKLLSETPKSIGFIILFGSASRKQERKDSDIDILVVLNDFNNTKLQKEYEQEMKREIEELKDRISATSIHPITIIYTTINEFKNTEDRLIAEARNTGFCIEGNLTYYEVMLDE